MTALYELLIRGREDGSVSGGHVVRFESDGTNADGSPRYKIGQPQPFHLADLDGLLPEGFAGLAAQVAATEAERDELKRERDALRACVEALEAERANVSPPSAPGAREVHGAWFRAALAQMGVLATVRAALDPVKLTLFDGATAFRIDHPDVIAVASALGIEVAAVFDAAEALRASNPAP